MVIPAKGVKKRATFRGYTGIFECPKVSFLEVLYNATFREYTGEFEHFLVIECRFDV